MIVNNSTYSARIDIPKTPVNDNPVQQKKSETESSKVNIPIRNPAKTAFGRLASYKDLLSRSAPLMSDEAFMERAKEQARKDFANNVFQGAEFQSLACAFVSVISPDRVGIIDDAIRNGSSSTQTRALYLWEILLQIEKGKETALPVSGIGFNPDGSINVMHICDSAGNIIIGYNDDGGWSENFTPEELARSQAMLQVYNDAWKQASEQAKAENNSFELIPSDLGVGSFNKLA